MATKARVENGNIIEDENGEYTLPVESNLMHRFELVDGVIVDKYNGVSDREVRIQDHAEAQARLDAEQAAWDALPEEERVGDRPLDLPELIFPED